MLDVQVDVQTSRGHKAALSLVPLLSDNDWHVALAASRGILRLETNRLTAEMQAPKGRGGNAEISGTLPYDHTITQALLAMIERTHEGADLLHMAVLDILDLICAKSDVQLLKHLVQRLIHVDPKVRETCLQAVKVVVNGKGLQFSGATGTAAAPRHKDGPGKYDAVVEACSSFIADLTAQQRACGKLQNQALEVEIALQKPGADKVALKAELARLEEQIRNLKLPPDEAAVLAGRLQTVMDCMCSVVPAGNASAIGCVVSGIENLHTKFLRPAN